MTTQVRPRVEDIVRRDLESDVFQPRKSRLFWLVVHLGLIGFAFGMRPLLEPRGLTFLLTPLVGLAFGGLLFVGHELLHGSIVRSRRAMRFFGFVTMTPVLLSPRLWMAWHNRTHHAHAADPALDPDAYPTREEYEKNALARLTLDFAAPSLGRVRGLLTLLIGFTLQTSQILVSARKTLGVSRKQHLLMILETLAMAGFWLGVAHFVGFTAFLWLWFVPVLLANVIVMSFILTNHSLSPVGPSLDALESSLSVEVPKFVDLYTLGFGNHVEHHLFPAVSHAHGPKIRESLLRHFPDRYQRLPLGTALRLVFRTPRVHDGKRLFDPKTGASVPALPLLVRSTP